MDQNFNNFTTPPDNYFVWAILSTLFCCMPLGIVAIIKANSVNELWYRGEHDLAYKASADAKKFSIISAILAFAGGFIYAIIVIMTIIFGSNFE